MLLPQARKAPLTEPLSKGDCGNGAVRRDEQLSV
jgi:hypothetical protein